MTYETSPILAALRQRARQHLAALVECLKELRDSFDERQRREASASAAYLGTLLAEPEPTPEERAREERLQAVREEAVEEAYLNRKVAPLGARPDEVAPPTDESAAMGRIRDQGRVGPAPDPVGNVLPLARKRAFVSGRIGPKACPRRTDEEFAAAHSIDEGPESA